MNSFQYRILTIAAFFGFTSVIMGAMGAHYLQKILTPSALNSIETGVRYQMYHAFALLILLFLHGKIRSSTVQTTFYLFTIGTILFSFSLFLFAILSSMYVSLPKIFFLITPLGGILLTGGWAVLLFNGLRHLFSHKDDSKKS
jgi:uncharacterized membrane protein YgdD (TMEM256/DUF423 family)